VNFCGEYTFRDIDADIDIQQIVDQLEAARSIEGAKLADRSVASSLVSEN